MPDATKPSRRWNRRWVVIALMAAIILLPVIFNTVQTWRLRSLAATIQRGDTRASVVARLGESSAKLYTEPAVVPGSGPIGAASKECYGGWFFSFRWLAYFGVDAVVSQFAESRDDRLRFIRPDTSDYPVQIDYDPDGTVGDILIR